MALPRQPLRLLIIDDHQDDRAHMLQLLRYGFPEAMLHEIADENGFAEAMAHASFDVVVTDYRLRWSDGLTVLKTIKTHMPHAAVIWVSRAHLDEAIVAGMKAGLNDYLPKKHLHRLVDVINDSLEHSAHARAQMEALQALQVSEQRQRAISALTSDYAYVLRVDAHGAMVYEWVSERFTSMTGYTLEALEGRGGWTSLIHPEDVASALQRRRHWLAGQTDISEFRILTQSGEARWVRDYTCPASAADGAGIGRIYGAVQDITQRRLLEEPLRHAQKMEAIGRLAGKIAHDFNNMLQVMLGYSDMLLRRMARRSPLRQYVQEVRDVAEQGTILTRQLMTLSRMPLFQPRVLEIKKVLDEMTPILRRIMGENIELRITVSPDLGQVHTDPGQLEQVIMNLAVNARDVMPQGGRLTLEAAKIALQSPIDNPQRGVPPGHYLKLTVCDTSPGMDKETQAHMFEPFFATKEAGKGADLSLFTAYGIVNQNGGNIQVESTPGVGTTFTIYWPCLNPSDEAVDAVGAPQAFATADEATILLVEDEAIVRDLVRRVLQASGYTVLEAANGEQALQVTREHHGPIHLLLADVVLPGLSGPEVATRVATVCPGLPVLYMSGYAQDTVERYGPALTSQAFLQKPFTPAALLSRVRDTLQASKVNPS